MIDLHSHVLFDMDDGARTLSQSVNMCRDAYENGLKAITLTPHFTDFRRIESFVRERNEKAKELRDVLKEENIPLTVATGAELYLSEQIYGAESLDGLTINNSRYMLCELPLGPFRINRVPGWIDELTARDYIPILAHPERYIEFHRNFGIIDDLLDRGVIFQVNLDSLLGRNGIPPQLMAIDMVERRIATIIATDAHDEVHRHNRLREKIAELPEEITDEMISECMSRVPRLILRNEEIF